MTESVALAPQASIQELTAATREAPRGASAGHHEGGEQRGRRHSRQRGHGEEEEEEELAMRRANEDDQRYKQVGTACTGT